jgi:hypothetical protein
VDEGNLSEEPLDQSQLELNDAQELDLAMPMESPYTVQMTGADISAFALPSSSQNLSSISLPSDIEWQQLSLSELFKLCE